jgi:hypothetical protein
MARRINPPNYALRRAMAGGILAIAGAMVLYFVLKWAGWLPSNETYTTQTQVFSESKFDITPTYRPGSKTLIFDIIIQSNEHPEVLATPPKEVTYLILGNGETLEPLDWHARSKTQYELKGQLVFQLRELPKPPFTLVYFGLVEQTKFTWKK